MPILAYFRPADRETCVPRHVTRGCPISRGSARRSVSKEGNLGNSTAVLCDWLLADESLAPASAKLRNPAPVRSAPARRFSPTELYPSGSDSGRRYAHYCQWTSRLLDVGASCHVVRGWTA